MSPGARWIAGLVALLVLNAGVMITLAAKAGDPSSRVIPDYYRKALAWDDDTAARAASAALGWTAQITLEHGELIAVVRDRDGAPVIGAAIEAALRPRVRADERIAATLTDRGGGRYGAALVVRRHGLHDVALTVRHGDATFLATGLVEP